MNDTDLIKQIYIDLCTASIEKNIDKLNDILSDNYILIHMTGMHQNKQEYIDSVIKGDLKYFESIHDMIEVKLENDKAFVIGKTKTLASPFGMDKMWWRLRQDLVFKKENNTWKIISSKASTY